MTVKPETSGGALAVGGKVKYQACDDSACYPAAIAMPFEATLSLSTAGRRLTAPAGIAPDDRPSALPTDASPHRRPTPASRFSACSSSERTPIFWRVRAGVRRRAFCSTRCRACCRWCRLKIIGFYEAAQHDRRQMHSSWAWRSPRGWSPASRCLRFWSSACGTITWGALFQQTWFTITHCHRCWSSWRPASLVCSPSICRPRRMRFNAEARHVSPVTSLFGILTAALSTPCTIGPFSGLLVVGTA